MTAGVKNAVVAAASDWKRRAPFVFRNRFRLGGARIGARLTACFVAIVLSMMAADVVAVWQFSQTATAARRLAQADQTSLAVVRVRLEVDTFRDSLAALASTHDIRQFTSEAATLRRKFVEDVAQSQQLLASSADTGQDPATRSALETLRMTLPPQLDSTVQLASAGDWPAVSLRVTGQAQSLIDLSSLLVERVDREVSEERAEAIESGQRARRELLLVLPVTALLTLLVAVALGWYATRSITDPLSELEAGARALAEGDFQHQIAIQGEDELAQLGRVFNHTARRLAALYETLRSNEARFRLTINTIPGYVWSALPDGSLDFINQRWLEFSGFSLEEGLGRGWEASVHPEDISRFVDEWRAALATGKPMESEARVRRADGQYRWLLIRNVPLHDETGKIVKWYGTSTDIEDRKGAEESLRRSEAYLAEAQRLTHTGSWACDPRTDKVLYWSEEMFRILGLDPQQGIPTGHRFGQRVSPEDHDRFYEHLQKSLTQKIDFVVDHRIVLPDETVKHIQTIGHPVLNSSGEVVEYIGSSMDVTERKRAEEDRQRLHQLQADLARMNRMTAMGELTVSLAHEIKQPIAAAITNANTCLRWLAREIPNIEEAREAAKRTAKAATRAAETISRVRSLFQKDAPQRELVDMNEMINEMVMLFRHEAMGYGVSIRTELASDLPQLAADRVQVQQVLMNLVINSFEAMKTVEHTRDLTLSSQRDGSDQVRVSVSDTGVGLPPEGDEIFNAFFTTKPEGTGMGLAISRSIVESHGGRLWATPKSGCGAIFHLTLPTTLEPHT